MDSMRTSYFSMPTSTGYGYASPNTFTAPSAIHTIRKVDPEKDFPFGRALGTRRACIFALVFSWISGFAILGFGAFMAYQYETDTSDPETLPHVVAVFMPLIINLFVTLLMQSTGYIHTASLRWSLQREGRLNFNSNLRLFTSSRHSAPNRWYTNALLLLFYTLAYASSSLCFSHETHSEDIAGVFELGEDYIHIIFPAVIMLGICILGFTAISTWALLATDIPSWGSSPLDTAYAAWRSGHIQHHQFRCMLSVHDQNKENVAVHPQMRQRGAWRAHKEVTWILVILWLLVILCFLVAGVIHHLVGLYRPDLDHSWGNWSLAWTSTTQLLYISPPISNDVGYGIALILLFALMQAPLTFGIHCAELQVNLSRDEAFWRKASSANGCRLEDYDTIKAAFTSWQSIGLFMFKSFLHWLFGLAVQVADSRLWIAPVQMIYLASLAALCALYITYISARRPKGFQPTTYGHLQTLVDLIDQWSAVLYWGHKADYSNVCHAGTAEYRLPQVKQNMLYW